MNPRLLLLAVLALAACGPGECKLTDPKSCSGAMVCERLVGQTRALCFQPVLIEGAVKVLGTTSPIPKAEVSAADDTGAPATSIAVTATDGTYSLRVETTRTDDKGGYAARKFTLRAAAQNFVPYPSTIRPAPLLQLAATTVDSATPFKLSAPDLTLTPVADVETGRPAVSGTVELAAGQSALVALEATGRVYTGVTDETGAFHIFNVYADPSPGTVYRAQAYSKGSNYLSLDVTVVAGKDTTGVAIKKGTVATATMMGTVQLMPGSNGAGTSVVIALESTYSDILGRGEVVPGLRAPDSGPPNLTSTYSISGIPDGKYVVLAAFENDGNVRDPNVVPPHVTVTGGVASGNPVFGIVGAVTAVSPGGGEVIEEVAGTPTFTWKGYTGANNYDLSVFSLSGAKAWQNPLVLTPPNADGNIVVPYGGIALKTGVIYQWRVAARSTLNLVSTTEDLRGLFVVK